MQGTVFALKIHPCPDQTYEAKPMNRNDLRRVDLNLLIVFETLMHERSVTRAAEKLFLGQPAISAALSRLRSLFDDPLFVRTGRSMEPSARAVEIFALLLSLIHI